MPTPPNSFPKLILNVTTLPFRPNPVALHLITSTTTKLADTRNIQNILAYIIIIFTIKKSKILTTITTTKQKARTLKSLNTFKVIAMTEVNKGRRPTSNWWRGPSPFLPMIYGTRKNFLKGIGGDGGFGSGQCINRTLKCQFHESSVLRNRW